MQPENEPFPDPPIIEAIIDIDCDLPPDLDVGQLEKAATEALRDGYPKARRQMRQEHFFKMKIEAPPEVVSKADVGPFQFLSDDEKQLIQFRPNGFSFNRLAPYNGMDKYFPEVENAWQLFLDLAKPVTVRKLGIRTINRILLPIVDGRLELGKFLKICPILPDTGSPLGLRGFLDKHMAIDPETGYLIDIIKTTQKVENHKVPLILDIHAYYHCQLQPENWQEIRQHLDAIRSLKNRIFRNTIVPDQCLQSPS